MPVALPEKAYSADLVVVGAGAVGLAIARKFAGMGMETIVLEAEADFGTGVSARNSEVIHAGIYYDPGSLKARLCAAGNRALYAYCDAKGVAAKRLGKLIVAVDEEESAQLDRYQARAEQNGVAGLLRLDRTALAEREPELRAAAALYSPDTGIVDSRALMASLLQDFRQAKGIYAARSPVLGGAIESGKIVLDVGGEDPCRIHARYAINAAGLGAQALAQALAGFPRERVPGLHYAIGHYFALRGPAPFRHLVYPVAAGGGLGVHLTLDMAGRARFGPDIAWRESEDYAFDEARAERFYAAIRRYWPALPDHALAPAYTGIRPKLWGMAQPEQDFMLQGPAEHGVTGLVNLFGIESPGLTCCLSIADEVATLLGLA